MSIYISCMEMPTSCYNCWALDDYGDYPRCRITEEQRGYTFPIREKRMDNCPLVPVPEHGDLIERDDLKELLEIRCIEDNWVYASIAEIPTIIPADPPKKETE